MARRLLLIVTILCCACNDMLAQQESGKRVYDEEHPLIYEDVWDLWPYAFLNENGKPDGYNIDLIRLLMNELGIPYVIKMKSQAEAFRDLRDGRSDLMLGLAVGFHDEFGHYSKNAVTLFTQSLVRPKNKPLEIRRFHDLSNHEVIVNDSSLCYHLMKEYGWSHNAIPMEDMREAIQQVSETETGQIVWNTLSLKWLMRRYHTDNLELTPINMQHGQYKFMSNDTELLDKLDETYTRLYSAEQLTPIQNKWFYPEREEEGIPTWVWWLIGAISLVILISTIYGITYKIRANRLTAANEKRNKRLALVLETSRVRIWTYDIQEKQFAWRSETGQVAHTYSVEEFSRRYTKADFARLLDALHHLSQQEAGKDGKDITLELRAKDADGGDTEIRDYYIVLSVLSRDKNGKPTVIIGTKKDVTEERHQQRWMNERTLRYWSIFQTPMVGILLFNNEGRLININHKACEMFCCDADEIIDENVSINDVLGIHLNLQELEKTDGYHDTQKLDMVLTATEDRKVKSIRLKGRLYNEFYLMTVYNDSHELLGVFAICHDITAAVIGDEQLSVQKEKLEEIKAVLNVYDANIDSVLHESDVRLATYSPSSHTLTIHRSVYEVQHALTQTRCMTLMDDRSKKQAMRLLNSMDEGQDKSINATLHTTLHVKGGRQLCLQFCLMPLHDKNGRVTEYLGLCRDLSELGDIEQRMAIEMAKVQEVEDTKNSFVKNMVQEIKTPMKTVIDYVNNIGERMPSPQEDMLRQGILENADYLLHLIDNILYLSRLEAHMVEIKKQTCNFADIFLQQCKAGWTKYQNAQTQYIVENPYEVLMIDVDAEGLGQAIQQLTANAAQHTQSGIIRARCEYIGRRLVISVDDTGEGIPREELKRLNMPGNNMSAQNTKGLGLAICRELLRQMDGTLDINSEEGSGTTVYMTIPCQASVIKRKKTLNL